MRMDQIKAEGIVIPMEMIEEWRNRKAELDRVIIGAQRESAEISRKLEAIAVLAPELTAPGFALTAPEPSNEAPSVISELAKVLAERKGKMSPKEIREALSKRDNVPAFSQHYFYTALKRAADKKLIRKVGDLYASADTSPQDGENPEARAPGS